MKNILKKAQIVVMLIFTIISYSQVNISISDMIYINGTPINNCGIIDFGSSTSVRVQFAINLSKQSSQVVGNSTLYVYTIGASGNKIERKNEIVQSASFDTSYQSSADITMNSSDFNPNGGVLFAVFKSNSNIEYQTNCNYSITKVIPPSFSLSPTSLSLACGDTGLRTFTVTPANIPSGATVTYQWSTIGWSTIGSTANSQTLQPASATNLPTNVSVTPYINGVAYPSMSCIVTRAAFTINPTLTGSSNLCPSAVQSVYTLTNAGTGNTVTWSLSNNSVATILSPTNTSATVRGTQNGSVILTATISNGCGQQVVISKTIDIVATTSGIVAPISYVTDTNFLRYCMNPQNTNTCGFQSKTIVSTANSLKPINFEMSLTLGNAYIQQLITPVAYNSASAQTLYSGDIYGKFYSSPIVVSVKANYPCNVSSGNFVTYMSLMGVANKMSQTNNSYEIKISPNKAKDFVVITKEDFDIPYLKVVSKYLNREVSDAELGIMKEEITALENSIKEKVIVKLFDFNSKEVLTTEMTTNELELNVSKFTKGLYIITVERGIEKVTQKLVIE